MDVAILLVVAFIASFSFKFWMMSRHPQEAPHVVQACAIGIDEPVKILPVAGQPTTEPEVPTVSYIYSNIGDAEFEDEDEEDDDDFEDEDEDFDDFEDDDDDDDLWDEDEDEFDDDDDDDDDDQYYDPYEDF